MQKCVMVQRTWNHTQAQNKTNSQIKRRNPFPFHLFLHSFFFHLSFFQFIFFTRFIMSFPFHLFILRGRLTQKKMDNEKINSLTNPDLEGSRPWEDPALSPPPHHPPRPPGRQIDIIFMRGSSSKSSSPPPSSSS